MLNKGLDWARQPSTVTGISALAAAAAGVASGQMSPSTAIPAAVFGVVAVLLPDNSAAWRDARRLASDTVALTQSGGVATKFAPVLADAAAVAADVRPAASAPSGD